jgi:hypothetical protein
MIHWQSQLRVLRRRVIREDWTICWCDLSVWCWSLMLIDSLLLLTEGRYGERNAISEIAESRQLLFGWYFRLYSPSPLLPSWPDRAVCWHVWEVKDVFWDFIQPSSNRHYRSLGRLLLTHLIITLCLCVLVCVLTCMCACLSSIVKCVQLEEYMWIM